MLSYVLTSTVCFLALIFGYILALMAEEELKPGKKYFILAQKILLALILFFFLFYYSSLTIAIIVSLLFLFIYHFLHKRIKTQFIYIVLAIIFWLGFKKTDLFLINTILIFLYGLPTGTLFAEKMLKKSKLFVLTRIVLNYVWFILIAFALSFF